MLSKHQLSFSIIWLLVLYVAACQTGVVDPGKGRDQGIAPPSDAGAPDTSSVPREGGAPGADLTAKHGDPCTYGKCAEGLICMANVCHTICSTGCGDRAPECEGTDGCHWVTSFSAACMPGTAKYRENCGEGVWCEAGNLCVKVDTHPARCLKLCKYGCPAGVQCGKTSNDCEVCIE
jgi:hypothetical protein